MKKKEIQFSVKNFEIAPKNYQYMIGVSFILFSVMVIKFIILHHLSRHLFTQFSEIAYIFDISHQFKPSSYQSNSSYHFINSPVNIEDLNEYLFSC